MKYGCICGWIGTREQRADYNGSRVCPSCLRKFTLQYPHPVIPCHWCGTAKHVQVIGERLYRCHQCDRSFDPDPNEGGTVATSDDPVRSAIQEEAMKLRAKPAKPRHHF